MFEPKGCEVTTTVAVTIAGRSYRMACGEGEEAHLQDLARHVDQTLASLRKGFGEIGDTRLVIMTAITVADELAEAKRRITELEGQLAAHSATKYAVDSSRHALVEEVAGALDAAADRVERIARGLREAGRQAEG
jgi:cell division protein ZapA